MSNAWFPPGEDPREPERPPRGEREVLLDYLDAYRLTLELKCEGLDADQLASRSVPPSTLSLLGLVRHMAKVEHHWFVRILQGRRDVPRLYDADRVPDNDFDAAVPEQACVDEAFEALRREITHARTVLTDLDLEAQVDVHGEAIEVRDVVVHMIEEYARHCGHADLLRECIDGRTGQ